VTSESRCFEGVGSQGQSHGWWSKALTSHGAVLQRLGEETTADPEVIAKLS